MRAALLALVLAARALAADAPPPVTVTTAVAPERTTIGTPVRYTIEVTAEPGVDVIVEQPTEHVGPLDIIDFGIEPARTLADGRRTVTRWFTLVAWTPGDVELPAPGVRWRRGQDEPQAVETAATPLVVESVLAATPDATDIRDIKDLEPVPADLRIWWVLGGALLAVAALVWLVRRLRRRGQAAGAAAAPLPPHVVAAAALAELARRELPQKGAFVEHYTELAAIVRTYIESRFGVRAPEMTTEEFLAASARDARLAGASRGLLRDFLGECDLVKFARYRPTAHDGERALEAARAFVDQTAEREENGVRAAG